MFNRFSLMFLSFFIPFFPLFSMEKENKEFSTVKLCEELASYIDQYNGQNTDFLSVKSRLEKLYFNLSEAKTTDELVFVKNQLSSLIAECKKMKQQKITTKLYGHISLSEFAELCLESSLKRINQELKTFFAREENNEETNKIFELLALIKNKLSAEPKTAKVFEEALDLIIKASEIAMKHADEIIKNGAHKGKTWGYFAQEILQKKYFQNIMKDIETLTIQEQKNKEIPKNVDTFQIPVSLKNFNALYNIGNKCFVNATLQCLCAMPDLVNELLINCQKYKSGTISRQLAETINTLSIAKEPIDALDFSLKAWDILKGDIGTQQDASELMNIIVQNLLGQYFNENKLGKMIPITIKTQGFADQGLKEQIRESIKEENMLQLPMPLSAKNLEDCIKSYLQAEQVVAYGKNWYKKSTIAQLNTYFICSLKRNEYDVKNQVVKKNENPLPFNLEMKVPVDNSTQLVSLIGIIIHNGSAYAGHYTAYVKRGNNWFYCDDLKIHQLKLTEMKKIAQDGFGESQKHTPVLFIYQKN